MDPVFKNNSFVKKYRELGWRPFPVDACRVPVLKWYNDKYLKTEPMIRTQPFERNWAWKLPNINDAAVDAGNFPGTCKGHDDRKGKHYDHPHCSEGITVIDFDRLRPKEKPNHDAKRDMCGVEVLKMFIKNSHSSKVESEWDELPFPLLRTRNGGYHAYFEYDPTIQGGDLKARPINGLQPLVDVKVGPHAQVTLPMGTDSKMQWIVPPWDPRFQTKKGFKLPTLESAGKWLRTNLLYRVGHKKVNGDDFVPEPDPENMPSIKKTAALIDMLSQELIDGRGSWIKIGRILVTSFGHVKGKKLWDQVCDRYSGKVDYKYNDTTWNSLSRRKWSKYDDLKKMAQASDPEAYEKAFPTVNKVEKETDPVTLYNTLEEKLFDSAEGGELAQAKFLATQLEGLLYYNIKSKEWIYWEEMSKLWTKTTDSSVVSSILGDKIEDLLTPVLVHYKGDQRTKIVVQRKKLVTQSFLESRLRLMKRYLPDDGISAKLNSIKHLYPIKGKQVIDLKTLKTHDRTYDHYFTYESQSSYVLGDSKSEAWGNYMASLFPDREQLRFIQTLCGLFLTGETYKGFFIFIGETNSGKSTFINFLKKAMGPYATILDDNVFFGQTRGKPGAASPHLMPLVGLRLGVLNEIGDQKFNPKKLKAFTGDDGASIRGNFKEQETVDDLYVKAIAGTNTSPRFDYLENATVNRMFYILFTQIFDKSGETMIDRLKTHHMNDVFAWMCEGAHLYYYRGRNLPPVPEAFVKEKDRCLGTLDSVQSFLGSGDYKMDKTEDGFKKLKKRAGELFEEYTRHCSTNDMERLPMLKFIEVMKSKGLKHQIGGKKASYWLGITDAEDDEKEGNGN